MDKGGEWVKDSVYNIGIVIWISYNILWTCKFSNNIPNNDEII